MKLIEKFDKLKWPIKIICLLVMAIVIWLVIEFYKNNVILVIALVGITLIIIYRFRDYLFSKPK